MDEFKFFKNFKERGEWVEARFIADALRHAPRLQSPEALGRLSALRRSPLLRPPHRQSPGQVHLLPHRHRILLPVPSQLPKPALQPQTTGLLRRLRHPSEHLVHHSRPAPARRRPKQSRPHALPHAAPKEKSLPLRILPRSLALTPPPPEKAEAA